MYLDANRCSTLADAAAIQFLDRRDGHCFCSAPRDKDASLQVAPQVAQSIYYVVPRIVDGFFGNSEVAYRVPSVLAMAATLWFVFRLAVRFIHPEVGWFKVFACFSLRGINYQAADAPSLSIRGCRRGIKLGD
jgi:hypothetical protein